MKDNFAQTSHGRIHWLEAGSGSPLLLLHSNGCSAHEFEQVMEPLSKHYRVIAWDMPGHGDSDLVARHYSVEDYADAVVSFMDALDLEQAWVAGASIGGLVCVQLAACHASRLQGVVVIEAVLQSAADWQAQWAIVETVFGIEVQAFEDVKLRFRDLTAAVHRRWNIDRCKAGAKTMVDVMWAIREYDGLGRTGSVECPVAVIYGETGPGMNSITQWRASLPRARHHILPGCGHFPMIDDPKHFEQVLLSCLRDMKP